MMASRRNVFVIGATGYIGAAVSRAFVRAGWNVYGLTRREAAAPRLIGEEIIPVLGGLPSAGAGPDSPDLAFLSSGLYRHTKTFDAIVSSTDDLAEYPAHYARVVTLIRAVATTSNAHGVRPYVLWTSGSKDYGYSPLDGTPGLAPHTEDSPLEVPDFLKPRTVHSLKILDAEHAALFDAAVIRPPNVYGYSSSHYGIIFEWAAQVKSQLAESGASNYELAIDPRTIITAMHVDDCGEAYVALAEHPNRSQVAGRAFNVGPHRYETTGKLLDVLARVYDIPGGFRFADTEQAKKNAAGVISGLLGWSQWLGSDQIRKITGWTDKRMLFTENLAVYRGAYEFAVKTGHEDVAKVTRVKKILETFFD